MAAVPHFDMKPGERLKPIREITEVATFLIERSKRPVLPNALREKASFNLG